jgi:hypothetical protein
MRRVNSTRQAISLCGVVPYFQAPSVLLKNLPQLGEDKLKLGRHNACLKGVESRFYRQDLSGSIGTPTEKNDTRSPVCDSARYQCAFTHTILLEQFRASADWDAYPSLTIRAHSI